MPEPATAPDPFPASVTVSVGGGGTMAHCENSDVFPAESVAVAVTLSPGAIAGDSGTVKDVSPDPFVVTLTDPSSLWPWPWPLGSHPGDENNSILNVVPGLELSVPAIVVEEGSDVIEAIVG